MGVAGTGYFQCLTHDAPFELRVKLQSRVGAGAWGDEVVWLYDFKNPTTAPLNTIGSFAFGQHNLLRSYRHIYLMSGQKGFRYLIEASNGGVGGSIANRCAFGGLTTVVYRL